MGGGEGVWVGEGQGEAAGKGFRWVARRVIDAATSPRPRVLVAGEGFAVWRRVSCLVARQGLLCPSFPLPPPWRGPSRLGTRGTRGKEEEEQHEEGGRAQNESTVGEGRSHQRRIAARKGRIACLDRDWQRGGRRTARGTAAQLAQLATGGRRAETMMREPADATAAVHANAYPLLSASCRCDCCLDISESAADDAPPVGRQWHPAHTNTQHGCTHARTRALLTRDDD